MLERIKKLLFGKKFGNDKKSGNDKEYDKQIAFVGLPLSGKTTLIKRFKQLSELKTAYVPTMGLSMERFSLGGTEVIAADLGGQMSFRESFWKPIIIHSSAIVFLVDSAEKDKFNEAEEILEKVLEQAPREAPFLFLANKIDLKNAFKFDDIVSIFRLRNKLKGKRPFNFFQISALRGDNVDDALDWLRVQLLEFNLVIDFKTKQIPQLYEKYEKEISEILAPIVNDSNLSSDEKLSKLVSVITSDIIHREDIKEAWQKNELQIYFENALEILEERKKNKE